MSENGPQPGETGDFSEWERQIQEEPSVQDVIDAMRELLVEDDVELLEMIEIAGAMETDEDMGMGVVLGLAYEMLYQLDVDPDEFFRAKGIIE